MVKTKTKPARAEPGETVETVGDLLEHVKRRADEQGWEELQERIEQEQIDDTMDELQGSVEQLIRWAITVGCDLEDLTITDAEPDIAAAMEAAGCIDRAEAGNC
jgi:hypothetical protein